MVMRNTVFFHRICIARQRRNIIANITNKRGHICTAIDDIEKAFISHFQNLYTFAGYNFVLIENLDWPPIPDISKSQLCLRFSEQEV